MMQYKGYIGKVEFDDEAGVFHGEVVNTRDVVTFEGESVTEIKQAFQESIDDYLAFCASRGEAPDKPFSGQFMTRLSPELHRQVNLAARLAGKSLNAWLTEQLQSAVAQIGIAADRQSASAKSAPKRTGRRRSVATEKHGR